MKDELPMFIKFGPVALFAIKIPTPERFAVFMAQSLGGYQYQIQRYSHNKEKFNQIRAMLEGPKPFEMHTSDEYKMFETLELMSK
jgi:hypothetical protein